MVTKKAKTVVTTDPNTDQANVPPAAEFEASGAPVQIVSDVDPDHPAVDNDPRKGTTIEQNKIDFNDPTISGQQAVEKALGYKSADENNA